MAPELCRVESGAFFLIDIAKTDAEPNHGRGPRFSLWQNRLARKHNEQRYICRSRRGEDLPRRV